MKIAIMKFMEDGRIINRKCAMNLIQQGGEFTVCGCATPDSRLDTEDFECIGFEIGVPNCEKCKRTIKWFKQLN